jgi:hypothetical protein
MTLGLIALGAVGLCLGAGASAARADVRAGVEARIGMPLGGPGSRLAGGAVGGRLGVHWLNDSRRFALGVVGDHLTHGFQGQGVSEASMASSVGALSGDLFLGPADRDARAFLGMDVGFATMVANNLVFSSGGTASNGLYLAPRAGVNVALGKRVGMQVLTRYEVIRTGNALRVANARMHTIAKLGVGFNMHVLF